MNKWRQTDRYREKARERVKKEEKVSACLWSWQCHTMSHTVSCHITLQVNSLLKRVIPTPKELSLSLSLTLSLALSLSLSLALSLSLSLSKTNTHTDTRQDLNSHDWTHSYPGPHYVDVLMGRAPDDRQQSKRRRAIINSSEVTRSGKEIHCLRICVTQLSIHNMVITLQLQWRRLSQAFVCHWILTEVSC